MSPQLGSTFRRAFHLASPVFLVYYLLPDDLWVGLPKPLLAFLLWAVTLVIEVLRLVLEVDIIGIREYEKDQVSAYFWGGTGLVIGLLFFPPPFVVVAMVGMAWVDPLCALARNTRGYPVVPLIVYGVIAFTGVWVLTDFPLVSALMIALLGTSLAIAAEYPNVELVDDDFTMQLVPLVGTTLLSWLL